MKFRYLVIIPLAWSLPTLLANTFLFEEAESTIYWRLEIAAARLFWIVGCLAAALKFGPKEYLRRAWMLMSVSMSIYLLRDILLRIPQLGLAPTHADVIGGVMVFAGNICAVTGVFLLARAWKVAELKLPGSKRGQLATSIIALVVAIAIAGPTGWISLTRILAGDLSWLSAFASALGDIISLYLIAPLLLTALALRGGLLSWPWALLTTSMLLWLFYDAALIAPWLGAEMHTTRLISEFFRTLACTFGFSAGLAQRMVVSRMRTSLLDRSDTSPADS